MSNHIEQTLMALRSDREALDDLITRLESYRLRGIPQVPEPETIAQPCKPEGPGRKFILTGLTHRPRVAAPKMAAGVRRTSKAVAAAVSITRGLREPFTCADLGAALGNGKQASNFLQRWKVKGWVVPGPTRGTYQRTKAFGGGVTESSRALLDEIHKTIDAEEE